MTMAIEPKEADPALLISLTPIQDECSKLLKAKQYKSCEMLARMELSMAEQEGRDARIAWALLGDCAQATQQYSQAISYFRRIHTNGAHRYRLKEAQCLQAVGNVVEASSVLEMVPREERTLTIHMTLANLYLASGRNTSARECFLESLVKNPYVLEAVEWLAILGEDSSRVIEALNKGLSQNGYKDSMLPVKELVSAQFAKHRHQNSSALLQFTKLEKQFPNNVYLLLKIATLMVGTRTISSCRVI